MDENLIHEKITFIIHKNQKFIFKGTESKLAKKQKILTESWKLTQAG